MHPRFARRVCGVFAGGLVLLALACSGLAGCGYTVLKGSTSATADSSGARSESRAPRDNPQLPPGHPEIETLEDWSGRSFLDRYVGEDEPLRFENMRAEPGVAAPSQKAILTIRATRGGPALADVWQIHMDPFGWVTAAYWAQSAAGPQLDELLATRRVEFRLARESENALRAMTILLLPLDMQATRVLSPRSFPGIPQALWPYDDPGRIEIEYRIETLDRADPESWPGGLVTAPLDLVQLLIATWDDVPPPALRAAVRRLMDDQPALVNVAILAEAMVLAFEVEGNGGEALQLPLRVGR
jgi:hypothetical protein